MPAQELKPMFGPATLADLVRWQKELDRLSAKSKLTIPDMFGPAKYIDLIDAYKRGWLC